MRPSQKYEKWAKKISEIRGFFPFGPLEVKRDVEGNIHCDDGPAYISPTRVMWYESNKKHGMDVDIYGSISYHYEGIQIPKRYFTDPKSLTFEEIAAHPNAEVRYVGLKIFGYDNVREKCKILDYDEENGSELLMLGRSQEEDRELTEEEERAKAKNPEPESPNLFDEPLVLLKVINSTQEQDGTRKVYYLTVPPDMKTCKQAVAWTFGVEAEDYHPDQES
jgi:hypothetical protein